MRWTHKHTCLGMLAVAGAILAVAAMTPVDIAPDEFGRIGSGVSADPPSDQPDTHGAPIPTTTRPVITLGNLEPPPKLPLPWGPQLDDCVVIGWTDLSATAINPAVDHPDPVMVSAWNAGSTAPSAAAAGPDRVAAVAPPAPSRGAQRHDRPIC